MSFDLENMTRSELERLKGDVEKAIRTMAERDRRAALAAAEKAAAAHGFSLAEITGDAKLSKAMRKTVSPAKYVNPDDEMQTWTGKGRQPEWFKAAIAAGVSPDDMEISR